MIPLEDETPDELTDSQLDTLLEAAGVDLLHHARATTNTKNVLLTLMTTAEQTRTAADDTAPSHPATPRPQEPGPATNLPLPHSQAEPHQHTEGKGATAEERFVQSVNPQTRIQLRVHPDVVAACLTLHQAQDLTLDIDHALNLALDLDRALALHRAHARDHALDHARALDRALHRAHARALALNRALDRALDLTRALDHARNRALDLTRALTRALDRALDHALDLTLSLTGAHAHAHALVGACIGKEVQHAIATVLGRDDLPPLDEDTVSTVLDDFTTCDLRTADLTGIDLDGLRWTEQGTQWPAAVDVEDLKTRSEETPAGSGIYTVRSGTATVHDLAELT